MKYSKLFYVIVILLCFLFVSNGYTYYTGPKEYEISFLPHYLQVRLRAFLGDKSPAVRRAVKKYRTILGPGYNSLHHYGLGLICMKRVYIGNISSSKRKFNIDSAVKEFDFVIKHSSNERLAVMYEVWHKRGEALMLLNEIGEAVKSLRQSIKLNPDYFPSYLMLSDCYKRLGNNEKAEKILEIGRTRIGKKKIKK